MSTATKSKTRAALIRDGFGKHGMEAPAKTIQEYVKAHGGGDAAAAQISNIRTKIKNGKKRPGRKKAGAEESFTGKELEAAKPLIEQLLKRLGSHRRIVGAVSLFDSLQLPGVN